MKAKKSKNREKWNTLLKFKKEYFTIIEHESYNDLPLNENKINLTRTPLVKNNFRTESIPDIFGGGEMTEHTFNEKIVDVLLFKPKTLKHKAPTMDEKTWLKKSVDTFNTAIVNRVTIVLEKNEDKTKLSIFNFSKSRQVGHRYFAKRSDDLHITFNHTTKNFFITISTFFKRRRNTHTTKNDFKKIRTILNGIATEDLLLKNTWYNTPDGHMERKPNNTQDIVELHHFIGQIEKILEEELSVKVCLTSLGEGLGKGIMEWFVKIWKIKVPNNYYYYLAVHYPGIRQLRKFKMNLGRAILYNKKLYGKYYVRLINQYGEYNLSDLYKMKCLLGDKYAKLVSKNFLKISHFCEDSKFAFIEDDAERPSLNLTKHEKLNLINLLKYTDDPHFLSILYDHLQIKNSLVGYGIQRTIKAKTLQHFNNEHSEWSDLVHLCQRNEQTTYHYKNNFLSHMEQDIKSENEKYRVKILNSDLEYFNEGQVQSNCVITYLDRHTSIIVSVRKGHINAIDRMTCEFTHGNKRDNQPRLIQSRLRFNAIPKDEWVGIEDILRKRFVEFCKDNKLEKPKVEIYNKISGKKYNIGEINKRELTNNFIVDLPF